jgi:hypothetical protein
MTAFLRNALLAAVAVSSMAGSALADQTVSCSQTSTNDVWAGRCCDVRESSCLGGGHEHGDHGNHGGRGGQTGAK